MAYDILKYLHIMSFVFMSVPLFNLIVVNERARLGSQMLYHADLYMENIIRGGVKRCFVFQSSVLVTGILLLVFGPLGVTALFTNWILAAKTLLLFALMGLLSYVHLRIQPRIDEIISGMADNQTRDEKLAVKIKPDRVLRKKLAATCLFIVLAVIILGMQVYATYNPLVTVSLLSLAALFSFRAYRTRLPYGWM